MAHTAEMGILNKTYIKCLEIAGCRYIFVLVILLAVKKINTEVKSSADSRFIWQGAEPCGPFRRLICALRPFSPLYMRPAALSVHISYGSNFYMYEKPV